VNRFQSVVRLADEQPDLLGTAERFVHAVREALAENENPNTDPAVMLIGAHISFAVHADVSTTTMYRDLIDRCAVRAGRIELRTRQ
jgi:hypothetical protein